jgi:hypothetical protein
MRPGLLFRQLALRDVLARLQLDEEASDDGITATDILRFPAQLPLLGGIEPYGKLLARLHEVVEAPEALLTFPYDWRRSIEPAAHRLEDAAAAHLNGWTARRRTLGLKASAKPALTLVCHSMGGLVARFAVEVLGGIKPNVRNIITLGTPFHGSVKPLRILASGEYLPLGLLAKSLRDAGRTLPGLYELVARYSCLAAGDDDYRRVDAADLDGLGASAARAETAFKTLARLAGAVDSAGKDAATVRPMVGLNQPTLQSLSIALGEATFEERLGDEDFGGDGTVFRRSAAPDGTTPGYLPQTHGAIAKSAEALTFVAGVLTEEALGPLEAEPTGIGIRVPDAVPLGRPLVVEIDVVAGIPTCTIEDTDTGLQVAAPAVEPRDGALVATAAIQSPGLFRVSVSGAGLSPVAELVPVVPA